MHSKVTLHKSDAEQGKGDVMEDGDGNLELLLLPREGSAISEKTRDEDCKVKKPTQPIVTCEPPSPIARLVRLSLADLSNTLGFSMCTSIPPKPSWTHISRSFSKPEEKLEVSIGKKRVSPPKKKQQGATKK